MNLASVHLGATVVNASSELPGAEACHLLDDDLSHIWLSDDGIPQWLCVSLEMTGSLLMTTSQSSLSRHPFSDVDRELDSAEDDHKPHEIRSFGWYCWHGYPSNPKTVRLHVSRDSVKFRIWDTFSASSNRAGIQLFCCEPINIALYPFIAVEVIANFGGSQTYMNQIYLYTEEIAYTTNASVTNNSTSLSSSINTLPSLATEQEARQRHRQRQQRQRTKPSSTMTQHDPIEKWSASEESMSHRVRGSRHDSLPQHPRSQTSINSFSQAPKVSSPTGDISMIPLAPFRNAEERLADVLSASPQGNEEDVLSLSDDSLSSFNTSSLHNTAPVIPTQSYHERSASSNNQSVVGFPRKNLYLEQSPSRASPLLNVTSSVDADLIVGRSPKRVMQGMQEEQNEARRSVERLTQALGLDLAMESEAPKEAVGVIDWTHEKEDEEEPGHLSVPHCSVSVARADLESPRRQDQPPNDSQDEAEEVRTITSMLSRDSGLRRQSSAPPPQWVDAIRSSVESVHSRMDSEQMHAVELDTSALVNSSAKRSSPGAHRYATENSATNRPFSASSLLRDPVTQTSAASNTSPPTMVRSPPPSALTDHLQSHGSSGYRNKSSNTLLKDAAVSPVRTLSRSQRSDAHTPLDSSMGQSLFLHSQGNSTASMLGSSALSDVMRTRQSSPPQAPTSSSSRIMESERHTKGMSENSSVLHADESHLLNERLASLEAKMESSFQQLHQQLSTASAGSSNSAHKNSKHTEDNSNRATSLLTAEVTAARARHVLQQIERIQRELEEDNDGHNVDDDSEDDISRKPKPISKRNPRPKTNVESPAQPHSPPMSASKTFPVGRTGGFVPERERWATTDDVLRSLPTRMSPTTSATVANQSTSSPVSDDLYRANHTEQLLNEMLSDLRSKARVSATRSANVNYLATHSTIQQSPPTNSLSKVTQVFDHSQVPLRVTPVVPVPAESTPFSEDLDALVKSLQEKVLLRTIKEAQLRMLEHRRKTSQND